MTKLQKRQKGKGTNRHKDKKTKRQSDKTTKRPERKYNIVTSGQFRTLAMFSIFSTFLICQRTQI